MTNDKPRYEEPPVHSGSDDRLERAEPDPTFLDSEKIHAWTPNHGTGGKWHHRVFACDILPPVMVGKRRLDEPKRRY